MLQGPAVSILWRAVLLPWLGGSGRRAAAGQRGHQAGPAASMWCTGVSWLHVRATPTVAAPPVSAPCVGKFGVFSVRVRAAPALLSHAQRRLQRPVCGRRDSFLRVSCRCRVIRCGWWPPSASLSGGCFLCSLDLPVARSFPPFKAGARPKTRALSSWKVFCGPAARRPRLLASSRDGWAP